jgi:hypothetical protein
MNSTEYLFVRSNKICKRIAASDGFVEAKKADHRANAVQQAKLLLRVTAQGSDRNEKECTARRRWVKAKIAT